LSFGLDELECLDMICTCVVACGNGVSKL